MQADGKPGCISLSLDVFPCVYFLARLYVCEAPWVYGVGNGGGVASYRPRWPILVNITDTHPIVLLYKPTFTQ